MVQYGLIVIMMWKAQQSLKNVSDLGILLDKGGTSCVIILDREGLGAEIQSFQI